jgi:hypothetical protein
MKKTPLLCQHYCKQQAVNEPLHRLSAEPLAKRRKYEALWNSRSGVATIIIIHVWSGRMKVPQKAAVGQSWSHPSQSATLVPRN